MQGLKLSQTISFLSEGLRLRVFLAKPQGKGSFPVVLVNHGGGGMEGIYQEMCLDLAGKGYAGVAMTFRGYPGSEGNQEYGKGEIADILNLVEYLKSSAEGMDPGRIGMFGYSRGALNALLSCQQGDLFKAVVAWSAPVEIKRHALRNPFVQDIIGGSPEEIPQEYQRRSPLNFVDKVCCPVLIIHGEEDTVIPVEHAYLLAEALREHNKPFRLQVYPGEGHSLGANAFRGAWGETVRFLELYLGEGGG